MGRFKDDFARIYKGMGLNAALSLIFIPRLLRRFGFKYYEQSKVVDRFISKNFSSIVDKYVELTSQDFNDFIPDIIWVFWWQGVNEMPNVIIECYESIIRNSNGRKVILLSSDNYQDYINVPLYVQDKVSNGVLSFTHFSDFLRVALLRKYGGLWIDAAIFVTKTIPNFSTSFYSPKLSKMPIESPHLSLWVIGVMGSVPNMPLFNYLYEMLDYYWATYDSFFSYLMFDYFIRYGYEHFTWLRDLIDNREIDSPDLHWSRYMFTREVDYDKMNQLLLNNTFISLTYRLKYPMKLANGRDTFYSALLKRYGRYPVID